MFRQLINSPSLQQELKLNPLEAIKRFYTIPPRNLKHRAAFGISKDWTDFNVAIDRWNAWDRITDGAILGTIPLASQVDEIIEFARKTRKPLGLVISAIDYFEYGGNVLLLKKIATPADWKRRGIEHVSLPMLDFGADVPVVCFLYVLDKMHECILKGMSLYDHCKAGVGRSALALAVYLAIYDESCQGKDINETLDKAIAKIKAARIQIQVDDVKKAKAIEVIKAAMAIKRFSAESKEEKPKINNLRKSLDDLLSSIQAKAEIAQLTSFKELAIYGAFHEAATFGTTKRTYHIRDLFEQIYSATNADWFMDYDKNVSKLLKATPWAVWNNGENNFFGLGDKKEDKKNRQKLVDEFLSELNDYFANKLGCNKNEIEQLLHHKATEKEKTAEWDTGSILKAAGTLAMAGFFAYQIVNKGDPSVILRKTL